MLRGNLAPDGCVIKPSACAPQLLQHTGPALVFDDYPAMKKPVDDENLDVTADHVMVLRNAGPQGGPGMPEWGMLPIPKKLLKQGVRDMLRITDARMSGTSYGACMLHVAPESFVGGPLALVRTGDLITVDVAARRIHLEVSDEELARRRAAWTPPPPRYERGYGWMFTQHILQANEGCDFDFLETPFGAPVAEPPSIDARLAGLGRPARRRAPTARRRPFLATVAVAGEAAGSRPWTGALSGHGQPPNACSGSRRMPAAISAWVFMTNGPVCATGSPIGRPCSTRNSTTASPAFTSSTRRRPAPRRGVAARPRDRRPGARRP